MSSSKPLYLQALDALRNREALFRVFIFTLVTVGFWIGFGIFFSQQQTKVAVDTQKHTTPLNPNINQSTLQELSVRKIFTDQELETFPIYDRVITDDKVSRVVVSGSEEDVQEDLTTIVIPDDIFSIASPSATPATTDETPLVIPEDVLQDASSSGGV